MLTAANLRQAVPFFRVSRIAASVGFYVDGLGFEMKRQWVDGGVLRWCWLERGGVAVMLQEFPRTGHDSWVPQGTVGEGVSVCFTCDDATELYREFRGRGLNASRPTVENGLWVTRLADPDGYRLEFESPTDAGEDSVYTDPT